MDKQVVEFQDPVVGLEDLPDARTKKTASRAAVSLYIWSTATGIRTPVSGLRSRG
jgi:hypothetical protein